ncbi:MAG: flagellar basal body L-ring protein FlgH [Deltaproteobacteria bacterium]|jgi:flagellar L-ring protein precursor FlgH|nr:flagellar basal body L-ring protein FlgH [Deltaproteobacteria bacterium]MDR1296066.1 flagellar basal body L-ring protein FlgH [Deltaproteobacteria bacterium]
MRDLAVVTMAACLVFLAPGCGPKLNSPSTLANQEAALVNPPVQTYPDPAVKTEGSLFSEDSRPNFFSDMKAERVGDIITINIVETSRASKTANTSTRRSNDVNASVDSLFGLEAPGKLPTPLGMNLAAGVQGGYSSQFSGTGSTSRNENITAKISARIVQVLPNDNLVVRGSQEILVNNEKQYITIQGVVRPADVATDNSVLSTYLADARIEYTGQGDLTNKQREGWLSRALDKIWPF